MLQREKQNDDQPIQPPLRNDNMLENYVEENCEEIEDAVNLIQDDTSFVHLTQDEYEKSLSFNKYFDEEISYEN